MTIDGGHCYVECLSCSGKMNLIVASLLCVFQSLFPKTPNRITDNNILICIKKAVAIKLDKYPIGSTPDSDVRVGPTAKAAKIVRIISRQHPIVQSRYRKPSKTPAPVEH